MSKFDGIQVGDRVGVRSDNSNLMRHYRYETDFVKEVTQTQFQIRNGWFPKETGRRGWDEVVTVAEMEENNTRWYAAQTCERMKKDIKRHLENFGNAPADAELLRTVEKLLHERLEQRAKVQNVSEGTAEEPAKVASSPGM